MASLVELIGLVEPLERLGHPVDLVDPLILAPVAGGAARAFATHVTSRS